MKKFKRHQIRYAAAVISGLVLSLPLGACSQQKGPAGTSPPRKVIRPPAVAGGFYPADPEKLRRMVDRSLKKAKYLDLPGRIVALIAPHAGYVYSGDIAAESFKQLEGSRVNKVLLVGPSHHVAFDGVSVYQGDGYRTPLGVVPVDRKLADRLRSRNPRFNYYPPAHSREHCLEVELPFLQTVLKDFKIVPVVIGQIDQETVSALGKSLAEIIAEDDRSLIVCSTDMTHYPPYAEANRIDRETLQAIKNLSGKEVEAVRDKYLGAGIPNLGCALCGEKGVLATIEAARRLGVDEVKILGYANSGDVALGGAGRVVGYGAVAFIKKEAKMTPEENKQEGLNRDDQRSLLQIARRALEAAVNGKVLPVDSVENPALQLHQGAFVTLNEGGHLRGCIGQFIAQRPLYRVVREMARAAALQDHRFSPVRPGELKDISIEISVLSPMRRVQDPVREIRLGRHGVYVKRGWKTGTFLPQVATETGWSLDEFMAHLCRDKAGLAPDAWKDPGTEVYVYTAQVFGENEE